MKTVNRLPAVRALSAATLVACVVFAVGLGVAVVRDVDESEHDRYAGALRRALELDARLGEEVAKARLGVVAHYDELVRIGDEIAANDAELSHVPAHITGDRHALLERDVDEYRNALDDKLSLVERFKTDHAVLRNSLRVLPHNVERLVERLPPERADLRSTLEDVLRDSLRLVLGPLEAARAQAVRCRLERLGRPFECGVEPLERASLGDALNAQLDATRRHAETVLDTSLTVRRVVEDLMAAPVTRHLDDAWDTYTELHHRVSQESRVRWMVAIGAAIALLIFASAQIIVRLQSAARVLERTKSMLELALVELERDRDREVELANLKSRFVSMTSHEFRTPLSVILSSAELLEAYGDGWDGSRRRTHLDRIQTSAKGMSRMLDDVLLIGRAEAGMLEAKPRRIRPSELAASVLEEVRAVVGPERRLDYDDQAEHAELWLDDKLLRHVLTNLLSNAFKYSPADSIVSFVVQTDEQGVCFEIADEGIGIPEDEVEQLFEAFHRCSNASAIPGTGLGLAVVKKSVEVHRGTIEVESAEGRGTRFAVRVPELEQAA